jgi:hypothetical protein
MVAENMTTLFRRAQAVMMYLVRLALDLFWDDNVTIRVIPSFDLVDAERLVLELFKSRMHRDTTVSNTLKVTYC